MRPDGTREYGRDFTVERTGAGIYRVTFPPGTWDDLFAVTVTPHSPAATTIRGLSLWSNGGGWFEVGFPGDVNFMFVAVEIDAGL